MARTNGVETPPDYVASTRGSVERARFLIEKGAAAMARDEDGKDPHYMES